MRSGAAHQSQSVPYRSGVAWNGCWWGISTNAAMTERVTLHLRDMAAAHRVRQALEVMEVDVAPRLMQNLVIRESATGGNGG